MAGKSGRSWDSELGGPDPVGREDVLKEDDKGGEDELAPEAPADAGATSGGPDAGDSASAADVTAEPANVAVDAGTITVPDPTPTTSASSGPDPGTGSTETESGPANAVYMPGYPHDLSRGKSGSQVDELPPSRWRSFWANIFKGTPAQ